MITLLSKLLSIQPTPHINIFSNNNLTLQTYSYQEYFLKEYSLMKSFFPVRIRWGSPKLFHHNKKCSNGNAQTLIGMWWWYLPHISAH